MRPLDSPVDGEDFEIGEPQQSETDTSSSSPPKFDTRANYEGLLALFREANDPGLWRFFT